MWYTSPWWHNHSDNLASMTRLPKKQSSIRERRNMNQTLLCFYTCSELSTTVTLDFWRHSDWNYKALSYKRWLRRIQWSKTSDQFEKVHESICENLKANAVLLFSGEPCLQHYGDGRRRSRLCSAGLREQQTRSMPLWSPALALFSPASAHRGGNRLLHLNRNCQKWLWWGVGKLLV